MHKKDDHSRSSFLLFHFELFQLMLVKFVFLYMDLYIMFAFFFEGGFRFIHTFADFSCIDKFMLFGISMPYFKADSSVL